MIIHIIVIIIINQLVIASDSISYSLSGNIVYVFVVHNLKWIMPKLMNESLAPNDVLTVTDRPKTALTVDFPLGIFS